MKLALVAFLLSSTALAAPCAKPWLMFDTGNTLIKVPKLPNGDPDFDNLSNLPGVLEYLKAIDDAGYPLGIVVNLGATDGDGVPAANPRTSQVVYVTDFIASGWVDPQPFPWFRFGTVEGAAAARRFFGRIYLGRSKEERKPAIGPKSVFQQAFQAARDAGCPAVFFGESEEEMVASEKVGFIPFWVGHTDHSYDESHPDRFWLRPELIAKYVKGYKKGLWKTGF
jgi:hypothetical protein